MIGIFDSGVGGIASFKEVRRLLPREDIIYLADRKNAPYGTKTEDELITLVKQNIRRLHSLGASEILIACCSASTVYPFLSRSDKKFTTPIIRPAAILAASAGERITVIATKRTVSCGAFKKEISLHSAATVSEIPMQELVALVEDGAQDNRLTKKQEAAVDAVCERIIKTNPDALILGCTHFSHLEEEFKKRLPSVRVISPAKVGASAFVEEYIKKYRKTERGVTLYT